MGRPSTRGDISELEMADLIKAGGVYEGRDGSRRMVAAITTTRDSHRLAATRVTWARWRSLTGPAKTQPDRTYPNRLSTTGLRSFAKWAIKVVEDLDGPHTEV